MKKIIKSILFSLVAAALVAVPSISRAQDSNTNAPAASKKLPIHGKAAAVDTAAMTLTIGTTVINITSETKISKDGKPATLSDIKEGDNVSASYEKGQDGKNDALKVNDGMMKSSKKKKKAASTDSSTNAPAAATGGQN